VTGFGTTYFAGYRDPGPFDVEASRNDEWEAQIGHLRALFTQLPWWKLVPADELVRSQALRAGDRRIEVDGKRAGTAPPERTYWAMAAPGEIYLAYVRGTREALDIDLGARSRLFRVRRFNPRTGEFAPLGREMVPGRYRFEAPDEQDWVVLLEAHTRND